MAWFHQAISHYLNQWYQRSTMQHHVTGPQWVKYGDILEIKELAHIQIQVSVQYIPRNMHTVFALLCFVVVIHWLIFPYPSGLLHWHCGNLTIAPVPAKQPWWIWINTLCEFIKNDCITTTKQSTTKPCAYFLGYTVLKVLFKSLGANSLFWRGLIQSNLTITPSNKTQDCIYQGCEESRK